MRRIAAPVLLTLSLGVASLPGIGCGLLGNTDHRSPGEVAKAFFAACDRGDLDTVRSLSSHGLEQQMRSGLGAAFGGLEGLCGYYTRNGDLQKVEVLEEHTQGERASVDLGYRFSGPPRTYGEFGDGATARAAWQLTKEEDGWKLAPSDFQ